jgi:hypothetical protein
VLFEARLQFVASLFAKKSPDERKIVCAEFAPVESWKWSMITVAPRYNMGNLVENNEVGT